MTASEYQTKPVKVTALQLTDNHEEFATFVGIDEMGWAQRIPGDGIRLEGFTDGGDDLDLPNGTWAVSLADGISFLTPAQFALTYEPVEQDGDK